MNTLLIIDDEPVIRKILGRMMELEGYEVHTASDCASALAAASQCTPQVILCDVFLPDGNGLTLITSLKRLCPNCEVIMLTAHGNIGDGVQAIKNGAFDYITKGDDNNKIIPIVNRAFDCAGKQKPVPPASASRLYTFHSILGNSQCLLEAIGLAEKVAVTDIAVLLTGETGTGKELFAQAIHSASARHNRAFMAINCSAFSKDLLESELFGHRAGAFTGATADKKGLLEAADGGTLFLDEIGEMDFGLQAKLLRVLESGEFIKIGDTRPTKVNVRVISATNRDLLKEIESGHFRSDLYYRLSAFCIHLPPLRDRKGDIAIVARYFMQQIADKLHKDIPGMTPDFLLALEAAPWKGNLRELRNVMERSAIVCDGTLTPQDLPIELQPHPHGQEPTSDPTEKNAVMDLESIERHHIARVLQFTNGNKTEAARLLKIGLTTLYRKIEEYHLK